MDRWFPGTAFGGSSCAHDACVLPSRPDPVKVLGVKALLGLPLKPFVVSYAALWKTSPTGSA